MAASAEATSQAIHEFYLQHAKEEFGDVHPLMVHVHAPGSLHMRDKEVRTLADLNGLKVRAPRSEEHTSELPSLMRISYAVFCLKQKVHKQHKPYTEYILPPE